MSEIEALLEKARRYLRSAELLLGDGDCESAVSRAYYAMFYCAQAALLKRDLSFSSHKGVISGFGEQFIRTGIFARESGREFTRAFEKRQIGDYEYTSRLSERETRESLQSARRFVDAVGDWLTGQTRRPEGTD